MGEIAEELEEGQGPEALYEEPELTVRVVRDLYNGEEFKEIVTDSPDLYDRIVAYLRASPRSW